MTLSRSTQLLIYSPAALHRDAWQALLSGQPGIIVAGAVGETSHLLPHIQPGPPTTILIDQLVLDPKLAIELKRGAADLGLLFLVQSYDLTEIVPILRAGANGFISRDASVGDLARAIIAVGRGELVLPQSVSGRALAALARGEVIHAELVEPLSEREVEVLRYLAGALTNKDIAQTLFLSVRTVEAHLRNIYGKLEVNTRTEAAIWAVRNGYAPEE